MHVEDYGLNDNNNTIGVQCNNILAGNMINSYGDPTNFIGYDFHIKSDHYRFGVIPMYVDGYTEDILPVPFTGLVYGQAGMFRISGIPTEVWQLSAVFEFDIGI